MSLFCLCTSFALFFDYILTFTLLAPIICMSTPTPSSDIKEATLLPQNGRSVAEISEKLSSNQTQGYFIRYSRFICSVYGRVLMIFVLVSLHVFSYYGIATMRSTFEPSKACKNFSIITVIVDVLSSQRLPVKPLDGFGPVNVFALLIFKMYFVHSGQCLMSSFLST